MKVWAVFLVVINCGGSYNDSLELHGIYSSLKKAEEASAELKRQHGSGYDRIETEVEEWEVQ